MTTTSSCSKSLYRAPCLLSLASRAYNGEGEQKKSNGELKKKSLINKIQKSRLPERVVVLANVWDRPKVFSDPQPGGLAAVSRAHRQEGGKPAEAVDEGSCRTAFFFSWIKKRYQEIAFVSWQRIFVRNLFLFVFLGGLAASLDIFTPSLSFCCRRQKKRNKRKKKERMENEIEKNSPQIRKTYRCIEKMDTKKEKNDGWKNWDKNNQTTKQKKKKEDSSRSTIRTSSCC